MSASLFDIIPGYREAVERERELRDLSFVDCNEYILGIEVEPFAPKHLALLDLVQSPFLTGDTPLPEHVAQFLWIVSPRFTARGWLRDWKRDWFTRSVRKLKYVESVKAIREYLADAFMDSPGGAKVNSPSPSYNSAVASLVFSIGTQFGWSQREIMGTPFKRLFQYFRLIQVHHDPKTLLFNASDRVRGEWLRQKNAKN